MSYRKLKAEYLFDGYQMHQNMVLVIRADGTIETVMTASEAGGGVENYSGMLTPGFVNAHCHLELSHLKNSMEEKQGLVSFVLSVVSQRNVDMEMKQKAARTAEQEMMTAGIVAVGDICNTAETREIKSEKRLKYYNFIELLGWASQIAATRYIAGKELEARFIESGLDEIHISLNPHAPYSVSDQLWKLMVPDFAGKTITIHNQESAAENDFFISGTGDLTRMFSEMKINNSQFVPPATRSLPYYLPKLKSAGSVILVHNTFMERKDLEEALVFNENLFFCFCPNANVFIEGRLPDIPLFTKYRERLLLGTDSLASNWQLSILEEIKTIKKYYPSVPTADMLLWATSNGARALRFEKELGDFTKDKKPGVLLLEHVGNGEISQSTTVKRII